jgi:hypothetical protein
MPNLLKTIISKFKPKVINVGEINPKAKESRRWFKVNNKEIKVAKRDGTSKYYTIFLDSKRKEILQLSTLGKELIKYPEIINFVKENIWINNSKRTNHFENKRIDIKLNYLSAEGRNHFETLKLEIYLKEKNQKHDFFLKTVDRSFLPNNEFATNQAFQKYGLNTIAPHFAYTDLIRDKGIIAYDYTDLHTLSYSRKHKMINTKDYNAIMEKVQELYKYRLPLSTIQKNGIGDFSRPSNIFIERENGKINVYFTDLLMGFALPYYY